MCPSGLPQATMSEHPPKESPDCPPLSIPYSRLYPPSQMPSYRHVHLSSQFLFILPLSLMVSSVYLWFWFNPLATSLLATTSKHNTFSPSPAGCNQTKWRIPNCLIPRRGFLPLTVNSSQLIQQMVKQVYTVCIAQFWAYVLIMGQWVGIYYIYREGQIGREVKDERPSVDNKRSPTSTKQKTKFPPEEYSKGI